jgi:hypothetical protein
MPPKTTTHADEHIAMERREEARLKAERARAAAAEKKRIDSMSPEDRKKEFVTIKLTVSRANPNRAYPIGQEQTVKRATAKRMMKAGEAAPVCDEAKAIFAELGASLEPAEMLT